MKYRSVLFVPGHEEKKIRNAYTLNPDLIVIDLESTVPDQERENAIYAKIDARFSSAEASFLKSIYQSIITESKKVEEL